MRAQAVVHGADETVPKGVAVVLVDFIGLVRSGGYEVGVVLREVVEAHDRVQV